MTWRRALRVVRRVVALFLAAMALYGLLAFGDLLGTAVLAGLAALAWPRRTRQETQP